MKKEEEEREIIEDKEGIDKGETDNIGEGIVKKKDLK